jgi:hypothetical protein
LTTPVPSPARNSPNLFVPLLQRSSAHRGQQSA